MLAHLKPNEASVAALRGPARRWPSRASAIPAGSFRMLRASGVDVVAEKTFADHYPVFRRARSQALASSRNAMTDAGARKRLRGCALVDSLCLAAQDIVPRSRWTPALRSRSPKTDSDGEGFFRDHIDTAGAQHPEEPAGIADAREGQHALAAQRRDRRLVGFRCARITNPPCVAIAVGRAAGRAAIDATMISASVLGELAADSGARNGPAGNTQALPRPRSPSITISEASFAIAGFWKPSSSQ